MSDQAFFGVWNGSTWTTAPRINYAYSSALAAVESAAKAGNYSSASSALLTYMQNRTGKVVGLPSRDARIADLAVNYTFIGANNDELAGEMTVSGTAYSVKSLPIVDTTLATPLTNNNLVNAVGKAPLGFMIMGKTKPQPIVTYIYSRENSSFRPTLELVIGGTTYQLNPIRDTFVQGGLTYVHGSDLILMSRGSGLVDDGYDSGENRTYLAFDLSSLPTTQPLTKATLKLYMATNSAGGSATNYVFTNSDTTWVETGTGARNWTNTAGNVYSWLGNSGGVPYDNPPYAYNQFMHVINRFDFAGKLAAEYQYYLNRPVSEGGPDVTKANTYAASLFDHLVGFANRVPAGHPAEIETTPTPFYGNTGLRLALWTGAYNWSRSSSTLTAAANTTILKRFWEDLDFLNNPAHFTGYTEPNNQALLQTIGLFQASIYLPEFGAAPGWTSTAITRVVDMMDALTFSDGSYAEGTSGYSLGVLDGFNQNIKVYGQNNGYTFPSSFDADMLAFARFNMHQTDPNGYDIQLGDAGYNDRRGVLLSVGNTYNDGWLKYVGSSGAQGTMPSETSSYYSTGRYVTQRSDWTSNALYLTMNNTTAVTHAHRDLLSVTINAYGRRLLVDTGVHTYDFTNQPDWFIYFVQNTLSHNTIHVGTTGTITLNGAAYAYGAQALHGTAGNNQLITKVTSNAGSDLAMGSHQAYANATHTRAVFFVRPDYWIVSDTVTNSTSGSQEYRQNWQFLPDANPSSPDSNGRMKTQYSTGANLTIVPADPASLTPLLVDGFYAAGVGQATPSKHARYRKVGTGTITYDTVLYPTPNGVSKNVTVTRLTTSPSVTTATATALKIDTNSGASGDLGYYYLSKETTPTTTRSFDVYSCNGRLAYAQTSSAGTLKKVSLVDAKTLTKSSVNMINSPSTIPNIDVVWNGTTLVVNGSALVASTNQTTGIAIYGPSVTAVTLNGTSVPFVKVGNNVYAVSN